MHLLKIVFNKQLHNKGNILWIAEATVTLGRGLTRCPRFEQNSRNRQSAPDSPQSRVLIRVVCLHTQKDEK